MRLPRRREQPPAGLLAALDRDERVVSWADTSDGSAVAVTPLGLWWPFPSGLRRVPWQHIDKAVWQDGVLTLVEADLVDDLLLVDRAPVSVELSVPRDLPPVLRKRVTANVVYSELLAVDGGAVRFVGRRRPGHDGVVWWARLEPGTPDSAALRAVVRAHIDALSAG